VKAARGVQDTGPSGAGAREFDRAVHTFAAGAGEKCSRQPTARALAQPAGEFPGLLRSMALKHRRPARVKLLLKRGDNFGMIVAGVVNAIATDEVNEAAAIGRTQLGAFTARILNIHL